MSKLRSVIRHEYLTIVKQPSFWIVMLAIPAIISFISLLTFFSGIESSKRIEELSKELKNISVVDNSGLITPEVAKKADLTISPASETDSLRQQVQAGTKDALIIYPEELQKDRAYQVYVSTDDLTVSQSVTSLADNLLRTSLFSPIGSAELIALAQDGAESQITTYEAGRETGGVNEYVVPGLFVVLFYIIFAFSVGYMLTSVSEEKENRSMEMVLTYVKPRTLILGKLLGVSLVTLTQVGFFALLAAAGLIILIKTGGALSLPFGLDVAKFTFEPLPIFFGAAFLVTGFLLFAGLMTTVAAAAPSTKEANAFSTVFYLSAFVPFYFISIITTSPNSPIVTFLTYFPLTSPTVTLIRNAVGNMSLLESCLALTVMLVATFISVWLAVRAFKLGALEFSQTIKFSSLFKR